MKSTSLSHSGLGSLVMWKFSASLQFLLLSEVHAALPNNWWYPTDADALCSQYNELDMSYNSLAARTAFTLILLGGVAFVICSRLWLPEDFSSLPPADASDRSSDRSGRNHGTGVWKHANGKKLEKKKNDPRPDTKSLGNGNGNHIMPGNGHHGACGNVTRPASGGEARNPNCVAVNVDPVTDANCTEAPMFSSGHDSCYDTSGSSSSSAVPKAYPTKKYTPLGTMSPDLCLVPTPLKNAARFPMHSKDDHLRVLETTSSFAHEYQEVRVRADATPSQSSIVPSTKVDHHGGLSGLKQNQRSNGFSYNSGQGSKESGISLPSSPPRSSPVATNKKKKERLYYLDFARILAIACVVTEHCGSAEYSLHNVSFNLQWVLPFLYMVSGYCYQLSQSSIMMYILRLCLVFCVGVGLNLSADIYTGRDWKGDPANTVFQMAFVLMLIFMSVMQYPLRCFLFDIAPKQADWNEKHNAYDYEDCIVPNAIAGLSTGRRGVLGGRLGVEGIRNTPFSTGRFSNGKPRIRSNSAKDKLKRSYLEAKARLQKASPRKKGADRSSKQKLLCPGSPPSSDCLADKKTSRTRARSADDKSPIIRQGPIGRCVSDFSSNSSSSPEIRKPAFKSDGPSSGSSTREPSKEKRIRLPAHQAGSNTSDCSSMYVVSTNPNSQRTSGTDFPADLCTYPSNTSSSKDAFIKPECRRRSSWLIVVLYACLAALWWVFYITNFFAKVFSRDPEHRDKTVELESRLGLIGADLFGMNFICALALQYNSLQANAYFTWYLMIYTWVPSVIIPYPDIGFVHMLKLYVFAQWYCKVQPINNEWLKKVMFRDYWPLVFVFLMWLTIPAYGRCDLYPQSGWLERTRFYFTEFIIAIWFLSGAMNSSDPYKMTGKLNKWALFAYVSHVFFIRLIPSPYPSLILHWTMPMLFWAPRWWVATFSSKSRE